MASSSNFSSHSQNPHCPTGQTKNLLLGFVSVREVRTLGASPHPHGVIGSPELGKKDAEEGAEEEDAEDIAMWGSIRIEADSSWGRADLGRIRFGGEQIRVIRRDLCVLSRLYPVNETKPAVTGEAPL